VILTLGTGFFGGRWTYLPLFGHLPAALDHLNTFKLDGLPEAELRLLYLCLAMVEAAAAVEMFDEVNPPYLMPVERFEPVHDRWPRS